MRLGSVKHKDTIVIEELYHPDGEVILDYGPNNNWSSDKVKPVTIEIYSPKSEEYKRKGADLSRELAAENNKRPKRAAKSGYTYDELISAEDLLRRQSAIKVKSWTGVRDKDGNELACTPENICMIFKEYDFVHRQVDEAQKDQSAFLEK